MSLRSGGTPAGRGYGQHAQGPPERPLLGSRGVSDPPQLFDPAQTQPQACPVGHCAAIRLAGQTGQLPTCAHDLEREHGHKRPRGCLNEVRPEFEAIPY